MRPTDVRRALRALRHLSTWIPQGLALVACAAVAWLVVGLEIMLLLTWPWPTIVMTASVFSFLAGAIVAVQLRGLALEPVHQRKDIAIDAALGTAFELQRVSTEHPVLPEPSDGEALEPPPWVNDAWQTAKPGRLA